MPHRFSPSRPFLFVALLVASASHSHPQSPPRDATARPTHTAAVVAAIAEASLRFAVPETWIRAVIRAESNGDASIVSPAGAIGLMQVMPKTYAELRSQLGIGPDPFAIRDNILAGTAYLRQMYDRFGTVGMAGAYNAGPQRWEQHLAGIQPLPNETVGYLAKLGPALGFDKVDSVNFAAPPNIHSSFESPLFFALASTHAVSRPKPDRQRIFAIVDANTTIVPRLGGLFARRSGAKEPTTNDKQTDASSPVSVAPSNQNKANAAISARPVNPLFAPRSHDRNEP